MMAIVSTSMTILFFVAYFWADIFITIGPGHAGVYWKRLDGGVQLDRVFGEGLHIIWPWNRIYIYDLRIQEINTTITYLDTSGLEIHVPVSTRFRPIRKYIPRLHQDIGPDYTRKLIIPELTSALRFELSGKTFQNIYTFDENELIQNIRTNYDNRLLGYDIEVDDVLIAGVQLPMNLKASIEEKLVHEQKLEAYNYILQVEAQEEQRKQIEARGIAQFEQTSGISILQWRGIDATEQIAKSPNAKVVIVGNDAGSLPVILNSQ